MEDLDRARVVPGAAEDILRTLEGLGLTWDGPVEYQSARGEHYAAALARLSEQGLSFECSCSRRVRGNDEERGYPGTCRSGPTRAGATATRLRVDERASVRFLDRVQGPCVFALGALGDVVIRRRDSVVAYQLAVVVDDAAQGVTDVVRGSDLLESTPWQLELQRALGLPEPRYAHLPLVVEPDGAKLAKSRRSVPLDARRAGGQLWSTLRLLRQGPPEELAREAPETVLDWAVRHWNPGSLAGLRRVPAP